ncbi:MAG TPA: hypothetical protein VNI01_07245, partial [Elusimicrobiota bacterium]|nr:hypothetical protein [Elusimicrobiota bacterium]
PLRDGAELGAADGSTFGAADETRGAGGAPTGPKSLRAGAWSATAELADGAERGPGFGAD